MNKIKFEKKMLEKERKKNFYIEQQITNKNDKKYFQQFLMKPSMSEYYKFNKFRDDETNLVFNLKKGNLYNYNQSHYK